MFPNDRTDRPIDFLRSRLQQFIEATRTPSIRFEQTSNRLITDADLDQMERERQQVQTQLEAEATND